MQGKEMTRNLKLSGLIIGATLALCATAPSGASASTAIIAGGPGVLAHDASKNVTFTGSGSVHCKGTYPGTAFESTITLDLELADCTSGSVPVTATTNGCHYTFTLGTLVGHQASAAAVSIVCPGPVNRIEFDLFTDAAHTERFCRIEIPEQFSLPNNLLVTDETNGHLRIHGTIEGIKNHLAPGEHALSGKGTDCVPFTVQAPNATLHIDMTVTGTEGGTGLTT